MSSRQQNRIITLDEFIIKNQKQYNDSTGSLTRLLRDIGIASKIVNREVNKAGLVNILGDADTGNASGDQVQKLDLFANRVMIECLENSGECAGVASEEDEKWTKLKTLKTKSADYVVVMDPLDGSSNIDVNVSVGTIFGIYKKLTKTKNGVKESDFFQKGHKMVAAGYVLYGTSTILVYTTGNGVNGFTLDPSIGEFCLSHKNIKMPDFGIYYSVNQGYYQKFDLEIRRFVDHCNDENYRLRYIGSMVSDVHRSLFKGGIFMYPNTRKYPEGKLRLLYECNPMAMIVEQAGGMAVDTKLNRILDIPVTHIHQRSTIAIGSKKMIKDFIGYVKKYSADRR